MFPWLSARLEPTSNITRSHERSVFAAWELSFEAIKKENPKATNLLLVCGFLGNDDLCDELLRRGMGLPEDGR